MLGGETKIVEDPLQNARQANGVSLVSHSSRGASYQYGTRHRSVPGPTVFDEAAHLPIFEHTRAQEAGTSIP